MKFAATIIWLATFSIFFLISPANAGDASLLYNAAIGKTAHLILTPKRVTREKVDSCHGTTVQNLLVEGGGTELHLHEIVKAPSKGMISNIINLSPSGVYDPNQGAASPKERFCHISMPQRQVSVRGNLGYEQFIIDGYADCGNRPQDGWKVGKRMLLECEVSYTEYSLGESR